MNKINEIMLRRKNMIYVPDSEPVAESDLSKRYVTALNMDMISLGYKLSEEAFQALSACPIPVLDQIYRDTIDSLKTLKGADVEYHPLWPNFPDEINDKDEWELYYMEILHYYSMGTLYPAGEENKKLPSIDFVTPKEVSIGNGADMEVLTKTLLSQTVSYSQSDREDLEYLMNYTDWENLLPEKGVTNKENLVALTLLAESIDKEKGTNKTETLMNNYHTATDLLRLLYVKSGGEANLSKVDEKNTKFINSSRKEVRNYLNILNRCSRLEEDMARHIPAWLKATHSWHVGDYDMSKEGIQQKKELAKKKGKSFRPYITPKTYEEKYKNAITAISHLKNKELAKGFPAKVEKLLLEKNYKEATILLCQRPGELARQMDRLLRNSNEKDQDFIIKKFEQVADKVSPEVLYSVMSHFKHTQDEKGIRTFMPKGGTAHIYAIEEIREKLPEALSQKMIQICENALKTTYAQKGEMGKVYIADDIKGFKAPMVLRNTSKSGRMIPRGSKLDLTKNQIARGFIWWTNVPNKNNDYENRVDIDLSVSIFDKDWKRLDQISYYDLRGKHGCHSGDITNGGPSDGKGVAEFIDINMNEYQQDGGRYAVFTVHNYSGYSFDQTPCKFGWMEREIVNGREAFEPQSVKEAITLNNKAQSCIPVIFDMEERKAIWADVAMADPEFGDINAETTKNQSIMTCYALVNNEYTDLTDIIRVNAESRGELTEQIEEADMIICDNPNGLECPENSKIIQASDLSAINALFINTDPEADKELLPDFRTLEELLEESTETKTEGLSGVISIIQEER